MKLTIHYTKTMYDPEFAFVEDVYEIDDETMLAVVKTRDKYVSIMTGTYFGSDVQGESVTFTTMDVDGEPYLGNDCRHMDMTFEADMDIDLQIVPLKYEYHIIVRKDVWRKEWKTPEKKVDHILWEGVS